MRQNPYQPRRQFDSAELAELEASLKTSGLLQPITVRRQGDAFELIAGERRLRAATNLGWTEISAIVRDFDDRTMLVLALVENLQRSNLNAIEEARGYRKLIDEFRLTQQQVAEAVGKDRTTVTNLLRVLSLPEQVQQMVEGGAISTGHARALLALNDTQQSLRLANETVAEALSVRELERRVRELIKPERNIRDVGKATSATGGKPSPTDPACAASKMICVAIFRPTSKFTSAGRPRDGSKYRFTRTTTWIEYLTSSCENAGKTTSTIVYQ